MEDVTNQKIKDLLADDDVDGLTRMVLINAVYFKANWQFAFNAEETFESRKLKILELPYEHPNRYMLTVLPDG